MKGGVVTIVKVYFGGLTSVLLGQEYPQIGLCWRVVPFSLLSGVCGME